MPRIPVSFPPGPRITPPPGPSIGSVNPKLSNVRTEAVANRGGVVASAERVLRGGQAVMQTGIREAGQTLRAGPNAIRTVAQEAGQTLRTGAQQGGGTLRQGIREAGETGRKGAEVGGLVTVAAILGGAIILSRVLS